MCHARVILTAFVIALVTASLSGARVTQAGALAVCDGRIATIAGTPGNDHIIGTAGNDVIAGRRGDDRILGMGGNDRICGGEGADMIRGGGGSDRIFGEFGKDNLLGGPGNDLVWGGVGADRIDAGAGTNVIDGGPLKDTVTYANATTGVTVNMGTGRATAADTDDSYTSVEIVEGTRYDDRFEGNSAYNTFFGLDGDDQFQPTGDYHGANAGDLFAGGLGTDQVFVGNYASAGMTGDFATGVFTVAGEGPSTYTGIESLTGTDFADTLYGDEEANVIGGYGGGDALYGRGGDDEIYGSPERDIIYAGAGNDSVITYAGNDDIFGEEGDDTLDGREGNDLLNGGPGSNSLDGGADTDTCLAFVTGANCELFAGAP